MSYGKRPCDGMPFVSIKFCIEQIGEGVCKYKRCRMYKTVKKLEEIKEKKGQQNNVN